MYFLCNQEHHELILCYNGVLSIMEMMMTPELVEFELPKKIRSAETLGFDIQFQEVKIRGGDKTIYQVLVRECGDEIVLDKPYDFKSWEEMKSEYPTLKDFLLKISQNEMWFSSWRNHDRIYYIRSLQGHQGLYDVKSTVWYDALEVFGKKETIAKKTKTSNKK